MPATQLASGGMPIIDLHPPGAQRVEVSFVLPCLNEARTIEACIRAARACLDANALMGEIIVADNGSSDGSQELARGAGARVIDVAEKGYGHALRGGILAARGRFIIMGDADLSYDFGEGMKFVERLRGGADLVMGNRFAGRIMPGAMPLHHRFLGNPVLSALGRVLFRAPVRDFHCGLRAFSREAFLRMDVRTTGMEFASELVIKARLRDLRIEEVPITLHKDGRGRPPHLRSFRDGWRHLRFMLTLSPRWTLFLPGIALAGVGAVLMLLTAFAPLRALGVTLDLHTLVAGSLMLLVGTQFAMTGVAMRAFAMHTQIGPPSPRLQGIVQRFTLERGLILGAVFMLLGAGLVSYPIILWLSRSLGPLQPEITLRPMIAGATLVALGVQIILMSFVVSMFSIHSRPGAAA